MASPSEPVEKDHAERRVIAARNCADGGEREREREREREKANQCTTMISPLASQNEETYRTKSELKIKGESEANEGDLQLNRNDRLAEGDVGEDGALWLQTYNAILYVIGLPA
ncbi:hypothetical protein L7F22_067198 [Adiantum nelumboides]|nr:hypothetical protein [Adiantum nelumboides]